MRKAINDNLSASTPLSLEGLEKLISRGFRFVQIRGLTADNHYDYIEPDHIILVPMVDLPGDPGHKDIYEPLDSELLRRWARDKDQSAFVFISS